MSSSTWAQWGALLVPHPDPREFVRPRASSSSAALPCVSGVLYLHVPSPTTRTLRHSLSTKSLSSVFAKKPKKSSLIPAVPPRLQPLTFTEEPIVDLTLPPYQSPAGADSVNPPWHSIPYSLDDDEDDDGNDSHDDDGIAADTAVPARANPTNGGHHPHLAAHAGHDNGRQRLHEFNGDEIYVTGKASPSLMSLSIPPWPHDAHTIITARTIRSEHPSCLSPTPFYPTRSSSNSSDTLTEAPLWRYPNHPAPATNFASSTTSPAHSASPDHPTRCPPSDETRPNYSIDATAMLKFGRKTSNVRSSAPAAATTTPSAANTSSSIANPTIIRRFTKKHTPAPIPSLAVNSLPVEGTLDPAAAAAKPHTLLEMHQAASVKEPEAAARKMPSAPRESVRRGTAPYSPFSNNDANTIDDAPDDNDGAHAALEEPRPPSVFVYSQAQVQSDCGHPHPQVQVQESRHSSDSRSYDRSPSLAGPTTQGHGAVLNLQLQQDSFKVDAQAVGPKADKYLASLADANNNTNRQPIIEGGSRSECGHGTTWMEAETQGPSEKDNAGEEIFKFPQRSMPSTTSPARWTPTWSRLSRSDCGHDGPRSLGARHPTADAPNHVAGAACVTAASSRSGAGWTALVVRAFSIRDGREVALATSSSPPSGSFDTSTAMSMNTKRERKQSVNVLHKRRATDGAVGAALFSVPIPASPLSQVSPLPASSAATDHDHYHHHRAGTELPLHTAPSDTFPPPSSWADHAHTSSSTSSHDAKFSHEDNNSSIPAPSGSGKGSALGFLLRRRWSVGRREASVVRGDSVEGRQRKFQENGVWERGAKSMDGEVNEASRLKLGDSDKSIQAAPGSPSTNVPAITAPIPRPKTLSHGKLTKPRPIETTQVEKRRPVFILGNESDVDLSSTAPHTHSIQRTSLTSAPTGPLAPPRPPLLPHNAYLDPDQPTGPGRRRWTLASAMLDEAVSDASLVRELERIRAISAWERAQKVGVGAVRLRKEQEQESGKVESEGSVSVGKGGEVADEGKREGASEDDSNRVRNEDVWDIDVGLEIWDTREGMSEREEALTASPSSFEGSPPLSSTSSWLAAQRALLTCRELLLTERRYLRLMQTLLNGHTVPPPPPLMLHYVAELVHASESVLADMERQPSVAGIAEAFVRHQEELETAYVRWCGVVGGWFSTQPDGAVADGVGELDGGSVDGHGPVRRRRTAGNVELHGDSSPPVSPLKRTVSTWRKSMPSISSLGLGAGGESSGGLVFSQYGHGYKSLASKRDEDAVLAPMPPSTVAGKPERKHTARDLAILPTQRVMRYVLLYRDLLSHLPVSSTSCVLVERAIQAACRIADKCNRAQGNAAFIVGKPNSPVPEPGFLGARSGSGASHSSRGSSRRGDVLTSSSRPSSPSTKTMESMSSASHSTSMSGSTEATSATSFSSCSPSAFVDSASKVQIQAPPGRHVHTGRGMGSIRRTSMSAVSLSLMTSMGLGRGRAGVPQPMSGL